MARGFIRYKAYPFVEKDPVLGFIWAVKRNKGLKNAEIKNEGGPTVSTLKSWEPDGKVRRPQFATVAAACMAMGIDSVPLTSAGRNKLKG
jgi:hypothetical protein